MNPLLIQLFIALFGLTAIALAMGGNPRHRQIAPVIGLAGQPFWAWFAWQSEGWGLGLLVAAYTVVYLLAIVRQWRKP